MIKPAKAKIKDAQQIQKLINNFAAKGLMLARSLSEIYENIRDYYVIKQDEKLLACGALHVCWENLAEIKSIAVTEVHQNKGYGDILVKTFLQEAEYLGIATIFCLTYKPDFFLRHGFSQIERNDLPQKVWGECYRCPKFPDCDEVAMILHF